MHTSYAKQISRSNDLFWHFLAAHSLTGFKSDDIGVAGWLFQTTRDLGIPSECLNKIERTLIEFVKQTGVRFNQGKVVIPIVIRLFYGKKMIKSENLAKTGRDLQLKQTIEPARMIHASDTKILGGWGFFIIERAGDFPAGSFVGSADFIDLYLYQEGE